MSKRFRDNQKVGDILSDIISKNSLENGINQILVEKTWYDVMGNGIKTYTTQVRLKESQLTVHISSSVVREELSFGKSKIIEMLNEALEKEIITELILRGSVY